MQAAKADVLGPRHSTAALQSTIAEPWMSTVKADAAKAQEAGWFWQFTINSVKVRTSHTFVKRPRTLILYAFH